MNITFVSAKQAKETYPYRNTRENPYIKNAAIWYNKICREKQEFLDKNKLGKVSAYVGFIKKNC
jgi:predicted ATPase with chaperone activity